MVPAGQTKKLWQTVYIKHKKKFDSAKTQHLSKALSAATAVKVAVAVATFVKAMNQLC